jgi:hypothetical protein
LSWAEAKQTQKLLAEGAVRDKTLPDFGITASLPWDAHMQWILFGKHDNPWYTSVMLAILEFRKVFIFIFLKSFMDTLILIILILFFYYSGLTFPHKGSFLGHDLTIIT